jgi:flavorubredoxin
VDDAAASLPVCERGRRLDLGDRALGAMMPPLFDNPTTRGLFDDRTGVLWAVDSFASPVPEPLERADDLTDSQFEEGQLLGARILAPWHVWLDRDKFCAHVDQVRSMPINVIASCHAPTIDGHRVERAFGLLDSLPDAESWAPFPKVIWSSG